MIFAIPRGRITYVGTTDTNYTGGIDDVCTQKEDAAYLIGAVNLTFTNSDLTLADIESSWSGLRPLIHEDGKSASELSRKDEIFESQSGLISIAGGKLTGYRKMAERVVDLVVKNYFDEDKLQSCLTGSIHITQPFFKNFDVVRKYKFLVEEKLRSHQLEGYVDYLVSNYGKQTEEIITLLEAEYGNESESLLVLAELQYGIEKELVCTSSDFFVLRSGML